MALEHEALTEANHPLCGRSLPLRAVDRQHGLLLNFAKTTLEPKHVIAASVGLFLLSCLPHSLSATIRQRNRFSMSS